MATASNETNPFYKIAHQNDTAKAVFSEWSKRLRDKKHVDIGSFRRVLETRLGSKFNRKDFEHLFRSLADLNAGHIAYSSKGYPKYFVLKVSLKDMGKAGTQQFYAGDLKRFISRVPRTEVATLSNRRLAERRVHSIPSVSKEMQQPNNTLVVIPVSEDRIIKLEVPENLTAKEVGMVTVAMASLRRGKEVEAS